MQRTKKTPLNRGKPTNKGAYRRSFHMQRVANFSEPTGGCNREARRTAGDTKREREKEREEGKREGEGGGGGRGGREGKAFCLLRSYAVTRRILKRRGYRFRGFPEIYKEEEEEEEQQ